MTTSEVIKRAVAKFKDETENYGRYSQDKEEEKRMKEDWKKKEEYKK